MHFYPRVLTALKLRGLVGESDTILVVAGGATDRESLLAAGFKNVTISNLSGGDGQTSFAPFGWQQLDGERLSVPDEAFDWSIVHAGLHHMAIPARGICEMFRVSRKGILCIEARDSVLMRAAVRMGLTTEYELEPAYLSGGQCGGYRDGPIPNYVYRWTEREFEKTVSSFAPSHQHTFFYEYGYRVPLQRFAMARSGGYRAVGRVLSRALRVAEIVLPRQGNQFAFGALKNVRRQPWLNESLRFEDTYLSGKYDRLLYTSAPSKPVDGSQRPPSAPGG